MPRSLPALAVGVLMLTAAGAAVAQDVGTADDVPDLEVDELEYEPEDPEPGDELSVSAVIENGGDNDASPFNVTVQMNGTVAYEERVDGLDEGNATEIGPHTFQALEGTYEVTVVADSDDEVDGDDRDDNREQATIEVEAANDEDETEETDDADDADDEDADDEAEPEPEHPEREPGARSTYEVDNGTYTGEHVRFTVDEQLPGIRNYTVLEANATLVDELQLPGELDEHGAGDDVFHMETDAAELMVRDAEDLRVAAETENGTVHWRVADGVDVEQHDRMDDEDEGVWNITAANLTVHLRGEDTAYENGTFAVDDEAMQTADLPGAHDRPERGDEHPRERFAGSQWDRENGTYTGQHVQFTVDEDAPAILDYTLLANDVVVFEEVALEGEDATVRAHGQMFQLRTDEQRVHIVDTPSAVLMVEAEENASAELDLGDAIEAQSADEDDEDRALYRLVHPDNRTSWLGGEDLQLDNGTATVEDKAHHRAMPFQAHEAERADGDEEPEDEELEEREDERPNRTRRSGEDGERGPPDEVRERTQQRAKALPMEAQAHEQVEQALARGDVGVEAHLNSDPDETVTLELGHVEVREARADPAGETKASMTIAAPHGSGGTTVTMNLDRAELGNLSVAEATERLEVHFDNETIEPADDLQDVLEAGGEEQPEYLLLVGGEQVQVLVSVPSFSVHQIDVTEASAQSEATAGNAAPGPGLAAAVAAVALASLALGTRKED